MQENYGKNTVAPNEFTDFMNIEVEHPEKITTILATTWANHFNDGIHLRQTALRFKSFPYREHERATSGPLQARKITEML